MYLVYSKIGYNKSCNITAIKERALYYEHYGLSNNSASSIAGVYIPIKKHLNSRSFANFKENLLSGFFRKSFLNNFFVVLLLYIP